MGNENHISRSPTGFFHWKPAAFLRVFGSDAFTFLQGQFTNDLREVTSTRAVYGLWLNHKGRVLGDGFVGKRGEDDFWIASYFSPAEILRNHLEAFIIADEVTVQDCTADSSAITQVGLDIAQPFVPPPEAKAVTFGGRRGLPSCSEWIFPSQAEALIFPLLAGKPQIEFAEMERARIEAGVAAVPLELGAGELPNEGGLENSAVSYTKGCYLGQEVMARLKSMGQVRRRLMRVDGAGAIPPLPAALFQGERRIGELRTAVSRGDQFIGTALLSLLYLREKDGLSFAASGENRMHVKGEA
jgi:folate-binding protein YgfZ